MRVPHSFTLQCCYGQFVHAEEPDRENLAPISTYTPEIGRIEYRIAYIAFCLENSPVGHRLYSEPAGVAGLDPAYVTGGQCPAGSTRFLSFVWE